MRHHLLTASSAVLALAIAGPAFAQTVSVNIAPGDLASALTAYSRVSGLEVLADRSLLQGKRTPGVTGTMSARGGLDRLLVGTGLAVQMRGEVALIVRAPASTPAPVRASSAATQAASQSAEHGADPAATVSDIVVTGSRITRRDYVAESPTVTLSQEVLAAAGPASIETTLNQMPQFASNGGASSTSVAGGGRANVNLRGLGIARTLVLMDGRRMQPSDPLGAVDLNTIAPGLIKNVEIITGGASAVYGSDAIAGVVNFQLKSDFQGLVIDSQYLVTGENDGAALDVSILGGGNFADGRGNAILSMSYFERDEVLRRRRAFFRNGGVTAVLPSGLIAADAANLPSQAVVDDVFGSYGVAPGLRPSSTYGTNPDGTLFSLTAPIVNFRWPDNGPYVISKGQVGVSYGEHWPLQQPMDRQNAFGRITYDLTDTVQAYAQFNYTHYTAEQHAIGRNQAITRDVYLPVTNPFLSDDLRRLMASRPNPTAPLLFYFNTGRFAPATHEQTYDVFQGVVGLKGVIDRIDGSWDIYGSAGRTKREGIAGGHVDRAAFLSLINAADGGKSICEGGLNPLVIDKPSQACLKYMLREVRETDAFEQRVVEGSLQGRLFALPAGDARFAAGFSRRQNEYSFRPDQQRIAGTILASSLTSPTDGSISSSEVFLEALAPLARDLPFAEELNLSLAYRFADYDTIGGVSTYKIAADWAIRSSLRIRGGYQRAIRAPSLGELFQSAEESGTVVGRTAAGQGDPCDITSGYRKGPNADQVRALCIANGVPANVVDTHRFVGTSVQSLVSGNPDLKEETADTYTIGLVWRPNFTSPWLEDLSASVDYYQISLQDAIGVVTGEVIAQRCFNGQGESNPTYDPGNYYCGLINRGPSGGFATLKTPLLNLGGYETSGVDLQADWRLELANVGLPARLGQVGVSVQASWLDRYAIQTLAGGPFIDYAGTIGNAQISSEAISHPEWKTFTSFNWSSGDTSLSLRWRWIDAMGNSSNVGAAMPTALGVEDRHYFDLTARQRLNGHVDLRGGIINLADEQPPEWTGESATDPAAYDVLGRRFYVGINLRF